MKKLFLTSLIAILAYGSFSQIAYYDAVELSKYIDHKASTPVFRNDHTSLMRISEILLKYSSNLSGIASHIDIISSITTNNEENKDYNPFLSPYLDIQLDQQPNNVTAKSIISSAGNLIVTNFADGLAKFLVERSKEELNFTFFRKFQKYLQNYPEVQIIFPTTYDFLNQIDSYQYAAMLPALKVGFQKDLNAFSTNLLKLRYASNYEGYNTDDRIKKRADDIISLLNSPEGRSIVGSLIVTNGIVKGNNAADIINNLANDNICVNHPEENFTNLIQLVDLISQSIQSNEDGRVWITKQQVTDLIKDEVSFKIYLGLIYAVDQKNKHQIRFKNEGNSYSLNKFLTEISGDKWNSDEATKFKKSFALLANSMVEVADNAKNVIDAKKQGDQASILVYADYASSIASLFNHSVNILTNNPSFDNSAPEMLKFIHVIDDATNACYDLKSQNYTALVLHTSSVLSEIWGTGYTFKNEFVKYGIFMANFVEANNSDEVQAAIEAAVLPVGSSSVKRETDFNISLNSFIGPYAGAEYLPKLKDDQWAFTAGLTAPVGVAFNWGNKGQRKKDCDGNLRGGKSYTIFFPIIDVGSIASFRLGDDSSKVASEVKLSNIISPGLFFYYGFGKCPISIGLGGQLGPQIRDVTASDVNFDKNYYLRFGFNLVVDIPFFNLYTKN